jgi:hypothetical protein
MLLHLMVTGQDKIANLANARDRFVHVQTVQGNYEGYTKRKVLRAKEAR